MYNLYKTESRSVKNRFTITIAVYFVVYLLFDPRFHNDNVKITE